MTHSTSNLRRERGFSLIELLIVVAIIGTVAAITIPALLDAKRPAHGASAISSLKVIHSGQVAYRAKNSQYGTLNDLGNAGVLLDPVLKTGNRSNYVFTISNVSANNYEVTAAPTVAPWRHFFMDGSGVIRSNEGAPADVNSPPIKY